MRRSVSVSPRNWVLCGGDRYVTQATTAQGALAIDHLGRPYLAEVTKRNRADQRRGMREVFTTGGYAIVAEDIRLATLTGLASIDKVSQDIFVGNRVLIEAYDGSVRTDPMPSQIVTAPGAIALDANRIAKIIDTLERRFKSVGEATIPRICFPATWPIVRRLQEVHGGPVSCHVDNRLFPSEIILTREQNRDTEVLAVTEYLEEAAVSLEVKEPFNGIVIDGIICA